LCDSIGEGPITVGVSTKDGKIFTKKQIYLINKWKYGDTEQAPVLIKYDNEYRFYAAWYEYEPIRQNKGIAIWRGTSLDKPDFCLTDTISLESMLVCDKAAELRLLGYHIYWPKPQRFDVWHFDLWDKENGRLGIIASAEKGDVIMLGESIDGLHFKFDRKPLVMNHYMQNFVHYRQYYYKPTVCVDNIGTHYFWTSSSKHDSNRNVLWHTSVK